MKEWFMPGNMYVLIAIDYNHMTLRGSINTYLLHTDVVTVFILIVLAKFNTCFNFMQKKRKIGASVKHRNTDTKKDYS